MQQVGPDPEPLNLSEVLLLTRWLFPGGELQHVGLQRRRPSGQPGDPDVSDHGAGPPDPAGTISDEQKHVEHKVTDSFFGPEILSIQVVSCVLTRTTAGFVLKTLLYADDLILFKAEESESVILLQKYMYI